MNTMQYVVCGAGGHAKVIIALIEALGREVVRVMDDDPSTHGAHLLGHRVEGPITDELLPDGALTVLGIGSNRARRAVAQRLPRAVFGSLVHPAAVVHRSVTLGAGSVVFAGAVVQPDTTIGSHVIVNTSASVDHDCVLGDFTHLAPGTHLAGDVRLEQGAFMGIGSCAIPGARIGAWATVGAGGMVRGVVSDGSTVVGVPARAMRSRR